jgi:hypothetical protein
MEGWKANFRESLLGSGDPNEPLGQYPSLFQSPQTYSETLLRILHFTRRMSQCLRDICLANRSSALGSEIRTDLRLQFHEADVLKNE